MVAIQRFEMLHRRVEFCGVLHQTVLRCISTASVAPRFGRSAFCYPQRCYAGTWPSGAFNPALFNFTFWNSPNGHLRHKRVARSFSSPTRSRSMIRDIDLTALKHITVDMNQADATALITLNRPKVLNALCLELADELIATLLKLDTDPNVRCFVVTGSGTKAFAAGADIKELECQSFSDVSKKDLLAQWDLIRLVRKPIIAAVNGYALGGGCELVMMCDVALAAENAKFGQPEVLLGTVPGMGGSQRLSACAGKSKAMEMILTGVHISATEAHRIGLVSHVYPAEVLLPAALEMAKKIASFSAATVRAAKEVVVASQEMNLQEGLKYERQLFYGTFATDDRKEGMAAFVEKKPAQWKHQ